MVFSSQTQKTTFFKPSILELLKRTTLKFARYNKGEHTGIILTLKELLDFKLEAARLVSSS